MERPQFYRCPQMKINNETFIHSGGPHAQKIITFVSLWLFMNEKAFSERNEVHKPPERKPKFVCQ